MLRASAQLAAVAAVARVSSFQTLTHVMQSHCLITLSALQAQSAIINILCTTRKRDPPARLSCLATILWLEPHPGSYTSQK